MMAEAPKLRSIARLWALLDEYKAEVENSPLSESSKTDYVAFAEQFVRWIDGDFIPGGTLR
jgi:hypothetical protein